MSCVKVAVKGLVVGLVLALAGGVPQAKAELISSVSSGKYLDVPNGSTADNVLIQQYLEGEPITLYTCPSRGGRPAPQRDYAGGRARNSALFAGRLTDIADGTSNTLLLAERCALKDGSFPSVPMNPWYNYDPGEEAFDDTAAADGTVTPQPTDPFAANLGFGSRHPGGVNMLLCDGSVRRFTYGNKGLQALIGRNDGLVVEPE
jgi:prepilin-type processing-associated H-X9-DG protein